ncbi:MAG: phosphopyruvate hydratase [Candidatus Colwellbacteria bacterium]|nr:phosphopyruvate hydratase [Candidatus Colwellbacteria bacterium]
MKIKSVRGMEMLDSRGNPTVQARVILENGKMGWAMVPSGASTGSYEAHELRDQDPMRYAGNGVQKAVAHVNEEIAVAITDMDIEDQEGIDNKMILTDGTDNKVNLGANAILAVSLAVARAAANDVGKPLYEYLSKFDSSHNGRYSLPIPMMNVMNGGKHANWATDIQEYMILPVSAKTEADAVRMCAETYMAIKKILKAKGYGTNVGDEGGYAPAVSSNEEPFEIILEAITNAGYVPGKDIIFGIDAAATEFFNGGLYELKKEDRKMTGSELASFYESLKSKYPIYSFEDVFAEDDWDNFSSFTASLGNKIQVVGDDLYVTNVKRLERGIAEKTTNSILIKLNQIGTLTETVKTVNMARENGFTAVISHRSGETEDSFIADLSVALGTGQIKTGAPCRSERTTKYNRLMEIEHELRDNGRYADFPFLSR